jgi:hypothetical protein
MLFFILRWLICNRAGTRIGRATYLYFAAIAVIVLVCPRDDIAMWSTLLSPVILLLNRLDESGPTAVEAKAAHAARQQAPAMSDN